jgi:hypothetical protein
MYQGIRWWLLLNEGGIGCVQEENKWWREEGSKKEESKQVSN